MSNTNKHLVDSIQNRLNEVQSLILSACHTVNRLPSSVELLAVTKTHAISTIQAAYETGLRNFGENYVQEGVDKIVALQQLLNPDDVIWHFIGSLQSNKTRMVAEHFDWVHTIDRFKIAQRLSEQRPVTHLPLNVCLQVNISHEPRKNGCSAHEAPELALHISQLPHLKLRGLMAVPAPINAQADNTAQCAPFVALAQLHQQIKDELPKAQKSTFDTLSMGMSNDFTHAIHAGSTMVRIGNALFGERNYSS